MVRETTSLHRELCAAREGQLRDEFVSQEEDGKMPELSFVYNSAKCTHPFLHDQNWFDHSLNGTRWQYLIFFS